MITIVKTIFSVFQVLLMATMHYNTKKGSDKALTYPIIGYMFLLTVVMWL